MKNYNNSHLGYYLAGLIEGDGNIWTSKTFKSAKGRIYNPRVMITFHINDMPLIKHIKEISGKGSIYKAKGSKFGKYIISDKDTLKTFNLINGKFRTPKIKYLKLQIILTLHKTNIEKLPLYNSNLGSNP